MNIVYLLLLAPLACWVFCWLIIAGFIGLAKTVFFVRQSRIKEVE